MNTTIAPESPILFEHFVPGALMGEFTDVYDARQAERWQAIFGDEASAGANNAAEGASMAVVAMMRAYLNVVTPRPPGNVHAKQKLLMHAVPRPGEQLRVAVRCISKEWRRERRYVELQATGIGEGGRPLFDGRLNLIWAA